MPSRLITLRFWLAATLMGIGLLWFALDKAALGLDFTDEGLYVVAPMRVALGEPLFSSEILTLIRPFEMVTRFLFLLPGSPSLYEFRLVGWLLHIGSYLLLSWVLFRECRSVAIALPATAVPFFVSFAWPSTIATPGYKSLSTDFLLVFLTCYYAAHRWPDLRSAPGLRIAAGLAVFLAAICYPPLVVIFAGAVGFDLWSAWRSTGPRSRRHLLALTSYSGLAAGLLTIAWLGATGAGARWLDRISLTQSFSLTSVRAGGPAFYGHLFAELFTKMDSFTRLTKLAAVMAGFLLFAPKRTLQQWAPLTLILFQVYTLRVLGEHYNGPANTEHFFFPTVYCLATVTWTVLFALAEVRLGFPAGPAALFCALLSIVACLLYATATFFFDYYYSWNNGILGLTFAFSLALIRPVAALAPQHRRWRWLLVTGLVVATGYAASYNYYGVRRDAPVLELTAAFGIPPLRGIRSSPARQEAIEALYDYLNHRLGDDRRLLVFDHAPMVYFILQARPAYGLAWAMREGVAARTHEQLVVELRSRPFPRYAVRTLVDLSEADWRTAQPLNYDDSYLLNATVEKHYQVEHTIHPFEILVLRQSSPPRR